MWWCVCACGEQVLVCGRELRNGDTKSCGCYTRERMSRRRESSTAWKGGRRRNRGGYVTVYAPESPSAPSGGHVMEHRLVMERHLGRALNRDEVVHHKNGVRDDNRLENLEMWSKSHPPGQRIIDKLEWAQTLIEEWGGEVTWTARPEFL